MAKTLIICCDYGRLGNRLHTHVNALAWCIENKYNLINLSFSEYAKLFESSTKHNFGNFHITDNLIFKVFSSRPFRSFIKKLILSDKWLERLTWIIKLIRPTNGLLLEEHDLYRQINKKINLIRHWDIRCNNLIQKHQNTLRGYLKPNTTFTENAKKIINDLRSRYDCIVGVHARRGDYETYLDGINYHSWESYLNWANQTKQLLETTGKKNVGILICSDEMPPPSITKRKSIHHSSNETMLDINLLSLCDYNIGPPSSFGTWVSWFGEIPRNVVFTNTKITSLDQFNICAAC